MKLKLKRPAFTSLAAVNLALLLALACMWVTPKGRLRNVEWQPPASVAPALEAAAPLPRWNTDYSRFLVTLDRPLFSTTRRPVPKAPDKPADTLAQVVIVGIWGAGTQGGVIATEGQQTRRVKVGEPLAGWTLKEIQPMGARFTRDGESRSLPLKRSAAPFQRTQ